jgi:5-methylcytosine-specific restriction protein A
LSRERGIPDAKREAWKGRGFCRWCEGKVEPPRQTFCKDECVHQWKLRSDPSYRRRHVFKRDGGICTKCGRDCHALERDLLTMLYANPSECDAMLARLGLTRRSYGELDHRVPMHAKGKIGHKVDPSLPVWEPNRSLWDADHVVSVVEGGGSCDLTNLQTLCFSCHKDKTAELARKRAEARRRYVPPDELFEGHRVPDGLFEDE